MADMIRRGKAVPVQAQRAAGPVRRPFTPTVIDIPGPVPSQPPHGPPVTAAGGGVQNVIYVVAPPPVAATSPVEVHHHHHMTPVAAPARRPRRLGKGTSFLGTLGMVVGGVGCLTAYLPQVVGYARPIALAGLGVAGMAWVGAMLFRRVGAWMPFLGLLVSAAAYGLWLNNTGQAQGVYDQARRQSPVPLPAVRFTPLTAAAEATTPGVAPPAPAAAKAPPAAVPPPPVKRSTIFDPTSPGWTHPAEGH